MIQSLLETLLDTLIHGLRGLLSLPPEQLLIIAGVLLVAYVFLHVKQINRPIVLCRGDSGQVLVTRKALKSLISTICEHEGILEGLSADIKPSRNKVRIMLTLRKAPVDKKITALPSAIERQLSSALKNMSTTDGFFKIDIIISGFNAKRYLSSEFLRKSEDPLSENRS